MSVKEDPAATGATTIPASSAGAGAPGAGTASGGEVEPAAAIPAAPSRATLRKWRKYLAEERLEEHTYRSLADRMQGEDREILLGLAEAERRHQKHWELLLGDQVEPAPKAPVLTRLTSWLTQHIGSIFVLALAQRSEQRSTYDVEVAATAQMAADERIHGEVVRSLAAKSRERLAGPLRAGLFGANDGLVSNLALILGVAGAGMDANYVLITGVSGLLAGALSMGAGEWVSVSGQRELLDASKPDPEAGKSVANLDVKANELELLFRARGETEEEAARHAAEIFAASAQGDTVTLSVRMAAGAGSAEVGEAAASLEAAADTGAGAAASAVVDAASAETGGVSAMGGGAEAKLNSTRGQAAQDRQSAQLTPSDAAVEDTAMEAIGTPWQAARSSFLAFAVGAVLPLLPYLCGLSGLLGAAISVLIVGISLFLTGSLVSVLSGRSAWRGALRQVAIGYGAAAVTFVLGLIFGTSV